MHRAIEHFNAAPRRSHRRKRLELNACRGAIIDATTFSTLGIEMQTLYTEHTVSMSDFEAILEDLADARLLPLLRERIASAERGETVAVDIDAI